MDEQDEILREGIKSVDLSGLKEYMDAGDELGFPEMSLGDLIQKLLSGESLLDPAQIWSAFKELLLGEVQSASLLGIQILTLCILVGMLENLTNAFGEKAVSRVGSMICSYAVVGLCLVHFSQAYSICGDSVDSVSSAMQILLPVLLPLIIAVGGPASGGALHPLILTSVTLFSTLIQKLILPCMFFSCVFLLTNSLTEKDYVKKLALFLRSAGIFLTGLAVTLFSGITALQGMVSKNADGMLAQTARYSIDNFVPIVGGFAADSLDLVLSCVGIIKNGVGIIGLLLIVALLLVPILKLLAIAAIYKLTAVLTEPIGSKVISDCMNELGNTIVFLAAVLFLTGILFLIFMTILISIGSGDW